MKRDVGSLSAAARIVLVRLRFVLVFAAIGLVVARWDWMVNVTRRWFRPAKLEESASSEFQWFCPMHPAVVRNELANCPSCGMPLSRRKRGETAELAEGILARLELSPYRIRQAGVATTEVDYRLLVREINAVGAIAYDDRRVTLVNVRIAGRVDEVLVGFRGLRVREGDPLYKIYSPGSVTTQKEFLQLLGNCDQLTSRPVLDREAHSRVLSSLEASRQRLRLWGMTDAQIAELEQTREVKTQLVVSSPATGVVFETDIQVGQELAVGQRPYVIADDSEVRVEVEAFERDLGLIAPGQGVELQSEIAGAQRFFGNVLYVEPELDAATHTVKVAVIVENRDGKLKPGMYVRATMWVPLGQVQPVAEEQLAARDKEPGAAQRKVYVCEMHKESVDEKPGKCQKCGGMVLEELPIPAGSKLVYTCDVHPEVSQGQPGLCPRDGKPLGFRVISEPARVALGWMCPIHPFHTSPTRTTCPDSGLELKPVRREDLLAVPAAAVIDTGGRKSVFIDRGEGVFEAVLVTVGPRAGADYPVLSGLKQGDRVVTAGSFLLDAEANLDPGAAAAYFGASGHETHR